MNNMHLFIPMPTHPGVFANQTGASNSDDQKTREEQKK